MKTLFVLITFCTFTPAARAELPAELFSYRPMHLLSGELEKGLNDLAPYSFKPGAASSCQGSSHPLMGGMVIFNCARVGVSHFTVGPQDFAIDLKQLQVRHQYYRPNPYEKAKPGDIQKSGWIRYYTYNGTYVQRTDGRELKLPLVLGAWFFTDEPRKIVYGFARLNGRNYPITGQQQ